MRDAGGDRREPRDREPQASAPPIPPATGPVASSTPGVDAAPPVTPPGTPPPFAAELALAREAATFVGAVAETARAEFDLSLAAMLRAATLGAAAALALVAAWLCGTIALLFALHAWLGSAATAFAIVAAAHALGAGIALWRRAIWSERVGFARTRAALAAAVAESEDKTS